MSVLSIKVTHWGLVKWISGYWQFHPQRDTYFLGRDVSNVQIANLRLGKDGNAKYTLRGTWCAVGSHIFLPFRLRSSFKAQGALTD